MRILPLLALCRAASTVAPSLRAASSAPSVLRTPRAVALDLDGTLFNSTGTVTERTRAALRSFVGSGGIAMLATGRGRGTAVRVASELADAGVFIACVVCSDGSIVLRRREPHDHACEPHDRAAHPGADGRADPGADGRADAGADGRAGPGSDAWSVLWTSMRPGRAYPLDALREALPGASFAAEIDGLDDGAIIDRQAYIDTITTASPSFAARFLAGRAPTPDFDRALARAARVGWLRALPAAAREADADALCRRVAEVLAAHAPESELRVAPTTIPRLRSLGALTILRRGTDKRNGLAAAASACGLDAGEFLAFGDHDNDLGMFAWAGQSVCPANANENAKTAATWCSPFSNDQDFIAEALEGFFQQQG